MGGEKDTFENMVGMLTTSNSREKPKVSRFTLTAFEEVKATILKVHSRDTVFIRLVEISESLVKKFSEELRNTYSEVHIEQMPQISDLNAWIGASAESISRGQSGFERVSQNPQRYGYTDMVYVLICKLTPYLDLPYIGYASNFDQRLRTHIQNALKLNLRNQVTRYIDKAILLALEREFSSIQRQIFLVDSSIRALDMENLDNLQNWLHNNRGPKATAIITSLIDTVLKKHFIVKDLEYHKSTEGALASEKAKTLSFHHKINGKDVYGTIFPNGLNMRAGGASGKKLDFDYPILDIYALVSLGFKPKEIREILERVYKRSFSDTTFINRVGDFGALQDLILKPVILELVQYRSSQKKYGFNLKDIAKAVQRNMDYVSYSLKEWMNGLTFSDLKILIDSGVDIDKVNDYVSTARRVLRYYSQQIWIDWLVGPTEVRSIAMEAQVSESMLRSKTFINQLASYLLGHDTRIYSIDTLRKNLKRDKTIESLRRGEDPRHIMEDIFQTPYESTAQLRVFYESLFSTRRTKWTFNQIILTYSKFSGSYLGMYQLE